MSEQQIRVLDEITANQIAAGEVVEKPASVVKELVENALDAGASVIEITAYGGGTEYLRVSDDGCGMSEADARMAVLRHATSKIRQAADLSSLISLGFRGEALPSIASVSQFTLLTRTLEADFATSVKIDGGAEAEVFSMGGSKGTTVVVENLFFNVPARRKFLKSVATEARYISELVTKLALSRPDVRFKLLNNDREVLSTPGKGDLRETVRAIYGKNLAAELLAVNFADNKLRISGYISKPTQLKGTRQWQTLFVNGRLIQSPMLSKAIEHAYQSQIPKNGFPFAVLDLKIDTASIDVNVHPQKQEIKFSDDNSVYTAVYKALTDALSQPLSAQQVKVKELLPDSELQVFRSAESVANDAKSAATTAQPRMLPVEPEQIFKTPEGTKAANQHQNDADTAPTENVIAAAEAAAEELLFPNAKDTYTAKQETLLPVYEARAAFNSGAAAATASLPQETVAYTDSNAQQCTIWPIGQVDKTFIVAQSETALYLIDQHAAHERIIYDKLCAAHAEVPAQQLLLPLYLQMPSDEIELLEQWQTEFARLGVDAAPAGENTLRVASLPTDIKAEDAENFIREIAAMLREKRGGLLDGSTLRQEVLHMTACKAAIKAGQLLSLQQMRQLIVELLNTEHPFTCPHGRPCMIEIDSGQLYKMFKRTGF